MSVFSEPTPIATAEQFRAAVLAVRNRMTDVQLKIIQTHCRSAEQTISLDQLAELLSLASWSVARNAYGKYARLIADELKFVPGAVSGKPVWLFAIAYGRPDADAKLDGDFEWTMRPELVQAMQAMKWA
jgi:hypothetical protein